MFPRRNVLILHQGALGDFVLTWPLAVALGRLFPQSRIIYVTSAQKGALAQAALGVESVDAEGGWHALYTPNPVLSANVTKLISSAHTIISFISKPDDLFAQNLKRAAPEAQVVPLRPTPPADCAVHASQYVLDQLKPWPVIQAAVEQILRSVRERGLGRSKSPAIDLLIHPGSGSREKCWPIENFIQLIKECQQQGKSVRVLIGEVERERWSPSQLADLSSIAPVHQPTSYVELLHELTQARQVLANDSGPGHLAGIMGIATLALFGPTHPAVWSPLGPAVRILWHQPLQELPAQEVLTALGDSR